MTVYIETAIPVWPKERNLARYAVFTNIDFDVDLADNQIWIDIGCRSVKALSCQSALKIDP